VAAVRTEEDRNRHIAWDPGALELACALADCLDAELLACPTSRLVIDANRGPERTDLILDCSDGTTIPGNQRIDGAERERRLRAYHRPYHAAIAKAIEDRLAAGLRPLLVSVHSFVPSLGGLPRRWPVGLLRKENSATALAVIEALARDGTPVGDNQPYDGREYMGYTLERHAIANGLPHILFELRHDQLFGAELQQAWAGRLAVALREGGMLP